MMLLDTEEIIKRIFVITLILFISIGLGFAVYYNSNLKNDFIQTKEETNILTSKLSEETNVLKSVLGVTTKEFKNSILSNQEETKKVDNELKQQLVTLKQLIQEYEKYKSETKLELVKLKDANTNLSNNLNNTIKEKEIHLLEQLKLRDISYDKLKSDTKIEINILQETIKNKEKDYLDIKSKLDKEIEYRNRYFFNR